MIVEVPREKFNNFHSGPDDFEIDHNYYCIDVHSSWNIEMFLVQLRLELLM